MPFGWFGAVGVGAGMGTPLLILGTTGASLLPKAGAWMNQVKVFFGVLLVVAVALWLVSRLLPAPVSLLLWALLAIVYALILGALEPAQSLAQRCVKVWLGCYCSMARWRWRAYSWATPTRLFLGAQPPPPRPTKAKKMLAFLYQHGGCRYRNVDSHQPKPGDARPVRRLVHQLQGDGQIHLSASRCATSPGRARWLKPTSPPTKHSTATLCKSTASLAHRPCCF